MDVNTEVNVAKHTLKYLVYLQPVVILQSIDSEVQIKVC